MWYDNFGNLDVRGTTELSLDITVIVCSLFSEGLYRSVKKEEFLKHKCYQGELCAQLCEQASVRVG